MKRQKKEQTKQIPLSEKMLGKYHRYLNTTITKYLTDRKKESFLILLESSYGKGALYMTDIKY